MSSFEPRILDASIHNVISNLNDSQKADVLLHALQHLPIQGFRAIVESAVQSLLPVPDLSPNNLERALLLRAKCRLAAGHRTSAQQDLLSVLTVGLENREVGAILQSQHPHPQMLLREPGCPPRFSEEVWQEIALFLPRQDLKSLLFVPNALSHIARQLLFREIDIYLTTATEPGDQDVDEGSNLWHYQRSADILTRILVDPHFAGQIKKLGIFAIPYNVPQSLGFQVGLLMNALPKLSNLRKVHCSGSTELITRMLQTVHSCHPRLQRLSLVVIDHDIDIQMPVFKHLAHFSISSDGDIDCYLSIYAFLRQTHETLRFLSIDNPCMRFPAEVFSVQHLTQLEFQGCLPPDMQALSEILANGHQLESLMLAGTLECAPSALFRQHQAALPFLRHFAFEITTLHQQITDRDLCPAISDFIRERTQLRTYHLLVPSADARRIGFNASTWGALPALSKLTSLTITYPSDLSSVLAGWLVPRTVRALTLDLIYAAAKDPMVTMSKLRMGLPPQLRYIGIMGIGDQPVINIVDQGFPNVRVVQNHGRYWTVTRSGEDGSVGVEEWPYLRVKYHAEKWLESLECTDAIWWSPGGARIDAVER